MALPKSDSVGPSLTYKSEKVISSTFLLWEPIVQIVDCQLDSWLTDFPCKIKLLALNWQ